MSSSRTSSTLDQYARLGTFDIAERDIDKINATTTQKDLDRALFICLQSGHYGSAFWRAMIKYGATYQHVDDNGNTILHLAAILGIHDLFTEFDNDNQNLFGKIKLTTANQSGETPFIVSASRNDDETLQLIYKMLPHQPKQTELNHALFVAMQNNQYDKSTWAYLCDLGADFSYVDANKTNFLHLAAIKGITKFFKKLKVDDKKLFVRNAQGSSVFHLAAAAGQLKIMKIIFKLASEERRGEALSLRNKFGRTPIMFAALSDNEDSLSLLQFLVEKGIPEDALKTKVGFRDDEENTLLHLAAISQSPNADEKISYLLEKGVRPLALNSRNLNPLELAIITNQVTQHLIKKVIKLVEAGVVISNKAIYHSLLNHEVEVLRFFIHYMQLDFSQNEDLAKQLLSVAILKNSDFEIAALLLEHGATKHLSKEMLQKISNANTVYAKICCAIIAESNGDIKQAFEHYSLDSSKSDTFHSISIRKILLMLKYPELYLKNHSSCFFTPNLEAIFRKKIDAAEFVCSDRKDKLFEIACLLNAFIKDAKADSSFVNLAGEYFEELKQIKKISFIYDALPKYDGKENVKDDMENSDSQSMTRKGSNT